MSSILLLAYEIETAAIAEIANRFAEQGKNVVVLQCDAWSFTDNIQFNKIHKNKNYQLITLEKIYRNLGKSKIKRNKNLDYWNDKLNLKLAFISDPLLCVYRHDRNYKLKTKYEEKLEFIDSILCLLTELHKKNDFERVITINNNYAVKYISFQYFTSLKVDFHTLLPTRISSRFGLYRDYGLGGDLISNKVYADIQQTRIIKEQYLANIKAYGSPYKEDSSVTHSSSKLIKKKLLDIITLIRYSFHIILQRPNRFGEEIHLTPSLKQMLTFELMLTFNCFRFLRFEFDKLHLENKKFVFYPLSYVPESSALTFTKVENEIHFARQLASELPLDTYLVVKEHPAMAGLRPVSQYKKLKEVDNIILANPFERNQTFLENCSHVVTQAGTIAIEAAIHEKPCTCLGLTEFSRLTSVNCKFKDVELINNSCKEGSEDINEYIERVITHSIELDMEYILAGPFRPRFDQISWKTKIDKLYSILQ